jgi:hypothetical protein
VLDGLSEAAIPRTSRYYLVDPSNAKGAAKALLCAAFGAAAWSAQPALLLGRLLARRDHFFPGLPAPQVVLGLVGGINHRAAVPLCRPGSSALGCGVCAYALPK